MNVYLSKLGVPDHSEFQANLGFLLVRLTIPPSSLSNITVLCSKETIFCRSHGFVSSSCCGLGDLINLNNRQSSLSY